MPDRREGRVNGWGIAQVPIQPRQFRHELDLLLQLVSAYRSRNGLQQPQGFFIVSLIEQLSGLFTEALGCGTPLVTSNSSSLPELAGDAAFAVAPDNVRELSGAILSCLVDDALVAELRQRGPKQAAKFSWTKMAQETVDVYRESA